jgi:hypothetical protein
MLAAEQFLSFLAAAMLITLSPGPDNLMVLGVGISRGRAQGMAFGLGCALGCLSHTLLAALGVSALIAASPVASRCSRSVADSTCSGWVSRRCAATAASTWQGECTGGVLASPFWQRFVRQQHQSEGRSLLPVLPAAIRRRRARSGGVADGAVRIDFHRCKRRCCSACSVTFPAPSGVGSTVTKALDVGSTALPGRSSSRSVCA